MQQATVALIIIIVFYSGINDDWTLRVFYFGGKLKQVSVNQSQAKKDLWPSQDYMRQVASLRNSIGQKIFLVEFKKTRTNLGVRYPEQAFELLDVTRFPKPDPANGIAPHMIILSDGRGVNLGRVARITLNKPFSPSAEDILYRDSFLMDDFLLRDRLLSKESIAACSKALLGEILGEPPSPDHGWLSDFEQPPKKRSLLE